MFRGSVVFGPRLTSEPGPGRLVGASERSDLGGLLYINKYYITEKYSDHNNNSYKYMFYIARVLNGMLNVLTNY